MGRTKTMRGKTKAPSSHLIGKIGTLADLHEDLRREGFSYQREIGNWQAEKRILIYEKGNERIYMTRIKRGKKSEWLSRPEGATSWLAKTAATPDTYKLMNKMVR